MVKTDVGPVSAAGPAAADRSDRADSEDRAARKAERQAAKQRADAERRLRRQQDADDRRAAEERERAAVAARAYEHYRQVRAWARAFSPAGDAAAAALTEAERRMLGELGHLWDAAPDVITALRRWTEPITGVRPADYDPASRELALHLKYEIGYLRRNVGEELFVQESPLLGGFGVEWHRQRYNEDTVRFFKAIVGLHDAGVLAECRGQDRRRVVWEIGGGWGGFAFQFKTLCPDVTYVITGLPECLLVSAVYLMTAFPDARCRLYEPGSAMAGDWDQIDFVFAPEHAIDELRLPALDAVLDVMALRQMSDARTARHVERAFELGARYFFSQLPGPCFPSELPDVWRAIERRYWMHQIPPRLEAAAFLVDDFQSAPRIDDYAQAVGWRRIRT